MKFKAKVKDNQLSVKVKISSTEVLNVLEINAINTRVVRGLLKPKQIRKNVIEYTGPSGIPLCDYLKRRVVKYEFYYLMAQIVEAIKKVNVCGLFLNNLILDSRYVYVNEATKEMQFIYVPIKYNPAYPNVMNFLWEITYSVNPGEDLFMSIAGFADFLRMQKDFNPERIERYISREDINVGKQIKRYNTMQSGFLTDKQMSYYKHYDDKNQRKEEEEKTGLLEDENTGLLENNAMEDLDEEATGILDSDDTALLSENNANTIHMHYACLVRRLNNQKIEINKPVFRLGKERSYVDYFIDSNDAVSRSHADIITRGSRYYVCDLNSMNHTYINNRMLPVKLEVEIHDGDILKIANEEFIFHI